MLEEDRRPESRFWIFAHRLASILAVPGFVVSAVGLLLALDGGWVSEVTPWLRPSLQPLELSWAAAIPDTVILLGALIVAWGEGPTSTPWAGVMPYPALIEGFSAIERRTPVSHRVWQLIRMTFGVWIMMLVWGAMIASMVGQALDKHASVTGVIYTSLLFTVLALLAPIPGARECA